MIPAQPGIYAYFGSSEHSRPVVAWNVDGDALVPDDDGTLSVARHIPGFDYIDWPHHTGVTHLIPGGGSRASWSDDTFTAPVIAWAACHDGRVRAFIAQVEGIPEACSAESIYSDFGAFTVSIPDEQPGGVDA